MGKFNDEMDKLNDNKKKKSVPKVKKCKYEKCPINADNSVNGQYTCGFHDSPHYHHDVTTAIWNNKGFVLNYNTMVRWNALDWQNNRSRLINHKYIPMNENETPSGYLTRFFKYLYDKIKNEASVIVERRKTNYPGGFDEEF